MARVHALHVGHLDSILALSGNYQEVLPGMAPLNQTNKTNFEGKKNPIGHSYKQYIFIIIVFGQTKKDHLAEATVCNFLCTTLHLTLNLHLLALLFGVEG